MSVRQMAAVWALDLPPTEKFVLAALADHADDDGNNVYPSVDRIAWKTGFTDRCVQESMRKLEARGILIPLAFEQGGRGHATIYRIDVTKGEPQSPFIPKNQKGELQTVNMVPQKGERGSVKGERGSVKGERGSVKGEPGSPQPSVTINKPSGKHHSSRKREPDPRTSSWQIQLYRKMTNHYPDTDNYDEVIQAMNSIVESGRPCTLESLRPFRSAWIGLGWNRSSIHWLTDCAVNNEIPTARGRPSPNGKDAEPSYVTAIKMRQEELAHGKQ